MKRYCIRIGILGVVAILGWIAVASAQRGGNEPARVNNPLRGEATDAGPRAPEPVPDEPPATDDPRDNGSTRGRYGELESGTDTIPDAGSLGLTREDDRGPKDPVAPEPTAADSAGSAEATAGDGPALLAPPPRQVNDRRAPTAVKPAPKTTLKTDDQYYDERKATSPAASNPAPRAASENEEPAPFRADPFDEPAAMPSTRNNKALASQGNAAHGVAVRTSADNLPSDNGAAYLGSSGSAVNASPSSRPGTPADNPPAGSFNNVAPLAPVVPVNTVGQANPVTETNSAAEGMGQPGGKQLEGPQSPQVMIQKVAPPEVQVGRPAMFKTIVRNTGPIPASQVEVRDMVPKGTRLVKTNPRASQGTRGEIVWTLGTLRPGEESAVEMELMPVAEGEIGSVATVHFGADASAKTVSTRPDLAVQTTAPAQVMIGEKVNMQITITNPGSGVATGVVLEEHLPAGLQHPAGRELEYNIGALKPGESKTLPLELIAATAGPLTNLLSVRADGNLRKEDRLQMEVVAPKLDIAMDGPKKRYLERQATYQVSVSNPGTAAAQGVELAAYLPPGMKFVSANNQGQYDEASRAVFWRLEQLPTRESGTVELVTMPVEAGQQNIKLRGTAQRVQAVEKEQPVVVEGIAAVAFQVGDSVDPIEVGGETTYEVRVMNQGSKAASNVQLTAVLPAEMQPLSADGPTRYAVQGNTVVFEGLARLAPKTEIAYHVRVKGNRAGDVRVRFMLKSDEMQSPVTKEESTQVYADE
jgi:uncharacterized repeat protein (TIGR01451 family)